MYQPNYPYTKEAYYYRKLFEKYYPGKGFIIPYFWLPKWVSMNNSVTDPSAREILD
jgi:asparagine synthase (glutamine-hydrolysing)